MLKKITPRLAAISLSRVKTGALDKRITGREHGRIRHRILLRDEYTCQACGLVDPGPGLEVDHIIPLCEGGLESDDNRQILCHSCHSLKSKKEQANRQQQPHIDTWTKV